MEHVISRDIKYYIKYFLENLSLEGGCNREGLFVVFKKPMSKLESIMTQIINTNK